MFAGAFEFAGGAEFAAAFASAWNEFVAGVSINAPLALSVVMFVFAGSVCSPAAGASTGSSTGVSLPLRTEMLPLNAGIEISNADNMKTMAATIVSFDNTEAVPLGPNAALDTLLVNNAPASVLPGCSRTAIISTKHETKKIVYSTYNKLFDHPMPPAGELSNYL